MTTLITDEEIAKQGFVYRWVPAGIMVTPHIDMLYPFDLHGSLRPKPAGVLAYRVNLDTDLQGVMNPWVQYLDVNSAYHGITSTTAEVTQGFFQVDDAYHTHYADTFDIAQTHVLEVQASVHDHVADTAIIEMPSP